MKIIEIEGVSFVANKVVAVGPVELSQRHVEHDENRIYGFQVHCIGGSVFVRPFYYMFDEPSMKRESMERCYEHCEKARQNFIKMLKECNDENTITGSDINGFLQKGTGA